MTETTTQRVELVSESDREDFAGSLTGVYRALRDQDFEVLLTRTSVQGQPHTEDDLVTVYGVHPFAGTVWFGFRPDGRVYGSAVVHAAGTEPRVTTATIARAWVKEQTA